MYIIKKNANRRFSEEGEEKFSAIYRSIIISLIIIPSRDRRRILSRRILSHRGTRSPRGRRVAVSFSRIVDKAGCLFFLFYFLFFTERDFSLSPPCTRCCSVREYPRDSRRACARFLRPPPPLYRRYSPRSSPPCRAVRGFRKCRSSLPILSSWQSTFHVRKVRNRAPRPAVSEDDRMYRTSRLREAYIRSRDSEPVIGIK